MLGTGHKLLG